MLDHDQSGVGSDVLARDRLGISGDQQPDESLVVGAVGLVAPQHGVERRENRRERMAAQCLEVGRGRLMAVPSDADRPDEALFLRPDRGRECAVGLGRRIELAKIALNATPRS